MSAGRESYIEIRRAGVSDSGKTGVWHVWATDGSRLGLVSWYGPWRGYAFHPLANTVFEQRCLREIADFCESESRSHRARARTARSQSEIK